jgi:hypothetical protein
MRILFITLFISSLIACNKHTVNKTQSLSRELTTIQFSTSNKPYTAVEEVGGEQINSTTIKAKAKDTYLIEVKSDNDSLNFYIDGQSIQVQIINDNPLIRKVMVMAQTEIELSFSAHPESSIYDLKITKL